ncbi:MAG: hypothetical protein FWC41_09780 [Firmicutes bacterium]|nr:hypothetical protein [Bacillota bacterium]
MKTPLQNQFEIQLKSLTGFEFQKAVAEIFLQKYGETGFTILRPTNDKGNDGIVESEKRVIACWGPHYNDSKKRLKDFENKINSDFKTYQTYWQEQYPNWSIVVNHQIDPKYDIIVKILSPNASVIGLEQLLFMIDNLKHYQKNLLGKYFKIGKDLFSQDYLHNFLEDLLQESEISNEKIIYDRSKYFSVEQKIKLNYDADDIQIAINEYQHFAENGYLVLVNNLIGIRENKEIAKMKNRIIYDYSNTNGNFKTRLKLLTERYCEKYSSTSDDDYLMIIRAVLITIFEQCLIGDKYDITTS